MPVHFNTPWDDRFIQTHIFYSSEKPWIPGWKTSNPIWSCLWIMVALVSMRCRDLKSLLGLHETLELTLGCSSTSRWVNEEQSTVRVSNQSQLWKQALSWRIIILPHLSLLSSSYFIWSSSLALPAVDSASCFLLFLSFPLHPLLLHMLVMYVLLLANLQEASLIARTIRRSRGAEANTLSPTNMSAQQLTFYWTTTNNGERAYFIFIETSWK